MKPWFIIPVIFITNTILQTALAWNGSKVPLVMLAVSTAFLACFLGYYSKSWHESLKGWGRSTQGWGAAQTWGMKQDTILRDVLRELYEYDEEAVEIHSGRSTNASLEYLKTFQEEDVEALMPAFRKETE